MRSRSFTVPSTGTALTLTELGLGTAPLGNLYKAHDEETVQATFHAAWDAGIRYFDTAPLYGYGLAETRLNHFLRGKPREDYVLSTKVGRLLEVVPPDQREGVGKFFDVPSRRGVYDYSGDGVKRCLEMSLERLGVDHVDIALVHDIDVINHGSEAVRDEKVAELMAPGGGYEALVKMRDEGVVKAFGGGINEWEVAQTLAERGSFDLFLLASRYTLLEQQSMASFLPLCVQRGIGIIIGGPYNSGILASGPVDGATYEYVPAPHAILERVGALQAICERHGVRLVEAALRFPLHHPAVISVIPGATTPAEVERNIETLDRDIPAALWAELKATGLMRSDAPVGDEVPAG